MEDKKIKEDDLKKVVGGEGESEPEEFDWRTKGYQTPKKDQVTGDDLWKFEGTEDNKTK